MSALALSQSTLLFCISVLFYSFIIGYFCHRQHLNVFQHDDLTFVVFIVT